MKLSILCLWLLLATRVLADPLGDKVDIKPVAGWASAPLGRPVALPTLRYIPTDGRNASVLLTLFPASRLGVSDASSLRQFHHMACTPFLPTPNAQVSQLDLKIPEGAGVYASFEDPSLVGKPPQRDNYKRTTSVCLFLGHDVVVQATIFYDEAGSPAYNEALSIVKSVAVIGAPAGMALPNKPASSTAAAAATGAPQLTVRPPAGFAAADFKTNASPGYFSYIREDGVMLTGWLDQAAKFKGMRSFWAAEKAALETNMGVKVTNESLKIVAGWNVVSYDVAIGTGTQTNLRACRVYGTTWADVHLSQTGDDSSLRTLEAVLAEIKVEPAR